MVRAVASAALSLEGKIVFRVPSRFSPRSGAKVLVALAPRPAVITLYTLDGCPYCERVHEALTEAGVDYTTEWVEALHSDRDEVRRASGQRGVPVLVDEDRGVTMAESDRIVEYVERSLA